MPKLAVGLVGIESGGALSSDWTVEDATEGSLSYSSGMATITPGTGTTILRSNVASLDFTSSELVFRMQQCLPNTAGGGSQTRVRVRDSSNIPGNSHTARMFYVDAFTGGNLTLGSNNSGANPASFNTTYNATNHNWMRFRESAGTTYFDTAPDSSGLPGSWTNQHSWTTIGTPTVVDVGIEIIQAGFASPTGSAIIGKINEGSSVTHYDVAADTGSFTMTGVAANFLKAYKVTSDVGAFSVTGSVAYADYQMSGEYTTYAMTGQDATLTFGQASAGSQTMPADGVVFTMIGQDVNLIKFTPTAYILTSESTNFFMGGRAARLDHSGITESSGISLSLMGLQKLGIGL